jgi:uncharacterized Zn finger protein (UPF0148 family)
MKSNRKDKSMKRVELKYCEHCGGLWVREGGGGVYCGKCQPKVAELAVGKKKQPGKVQLPVRKRTVVEDFEISIDDAGDLEGVGGAA